MPIKLSILSTPIGNLQDLSPRTIKTLEKAEVIFTESPKIIKNLLQTQKRIIAYSSHNEKKYINLLLNFLKNNTHVCLLSDSGNPTISDPGHILIRAAINAGYSIEVIPGPSAIITSIVGSGLAISRFAFLGFLPKKGIHRSQLITNTYKLGLSLIIFESPKRILHTLKELKLLLGDKKIIIARELTKYFETYHRGSLNTALCPPLIPKGEITIIIE